MKVEGDTIVITAKQEVQEAGGTRTRVFEQKFTLPNGVKAEKVSSRIHTTFFVFQQTAVWFHIVGKILHKSSVLKKSDAAAATIQEDMAVSDIFKRGLNIMVDSYDHSI